MKLEVDDTPIQNLVTTDRSERFEGLAFSADGTTLAVATADTNSVLLYRRGPNGLFEETPRGRISGLYYPHDVSFATIGQREVLAVAQRTGAISIFQTNKTSDRWNANLVYKIDGPNSRLVHSDGVAFVPPYNNYLAACNLLSSSISIYPNKSSSAIKFAISPSVELTHSSMVHPDGLAFSNCGSWLAVANHGNQTVSIFQRRRRALGIGKLTYGPAPIAVIADSNLRYPHSVAFTPKGSHLIVTNAGANFFCVYKSRKNHARIEWGQSASIQIDVCDRNVFRKTNEANKMEGGPKGVAVHGGNIALCSPEIGIKIYALVED